MKIRNSIFPERIYAGDIVRIERTPRTEMMWIQGLKGRVGWSNPVSHTCGVVIGNQVYSLRWSEVYVL